MAVWRRGLVRFNGSISLATLCGGFLALAALGFGHVSRPVLELSRTCLDLGTGSVGDQLTGSVLLSNNGNQRVKINKIDGGCGCLQTRSSKYVEAGKATNIQFVAILRPNDSRAFYPVSIDTDARVEPVRLAVV